MPKSEPTTPVPGTPRSDAGSAIAHGPFAAEVDKVPCPVRETFDWTDVRGASKQPIRPPVEQNWHTDVTRAHPNPKKAAESRHQRAVSIGAEALLAQFDPEWPSMPKSEPTTPVPGTPRSDAGSAIAHGPFAAEVDKVPCPVRETFDWTDVRGASKQPIRPPVEQNWHTDVTRAHPNPVEPAARCVCFRTK